MIRWIAVFGCLVVIPIMVGCQNRAFEAPPKLNLYSTPLYVTPGELLDAYTSDSAAADIKYRGKQIQLRGALVDEVQAWFYSGAGYAYNIPPEIKGPEDYHIVIDHIMFKPVDPVYLQELTAGSIVDIVGVCQGISGGIILVDDCWIKLVGGKFDAGGGY